MPYSPDHDAFIKEYSHKAFIKDIYLELPDYKYHHSPLDGDEDENFIGRQQKEDQLLNILTDSEDNGAYLITGYRGMGKTSFVKKVLKKFKKAQNNNGYKISDINISFAQFDLKERDILKQITKSLIDEAEKNIFIIISKYASLISTFRFIFFVIFLYFILTRWQNELLKIGRLNIEKLESILSSIVFLGLFAISLTYVVFFIKKFVFFFSDIIRSVKKPKILHLFLSVLLIGIIAFAYYLIIHCSYCKIAGITLIIVILGIIIRYRKYFLEAIAREKDLYDRLIQLYERCNATLTNESGAHSTSNQLPFGFISKNTKVYPIASPKEIEFELISILKEYNSFTNYKRKFIFIFDELDKVEPTIGKTYYYDDTKALEQYDLSLSQLNELRERKRVIVNILASLKYFITEAKARFIFIAGREMFDAALADIADRQSSISSIFSQIIYVDSFLKDQLKGGSLGLTDLIEEYFNKILLKPNKNNNYIEKLVNEANEKVNNKEKIFQKKNSQLTRFIKKLSWVKKGSGLTKLREKLSELRSEKKKNKEENQKYSKTRVEELESFLDQKNHFSFLIKYSAVLELLVMTGRLTQEERYKILFTLQDFIIYLTYRSNGAPKKLTKIVEDYIVKKRLIRDNKKTVVDFTKENPDSYEEEKIYLKISFKAQYKFNFITYLYRPFLMAYSQFIKKYSDYVLVSTPYLMDHLMKFHPFAFSVQNLELIPEVLSANRNPILRFFIEEIIFFLSQNHIRETEITLFDYKFYNKTSNEIIYLSKIFEEESAAFNFTLDETYFIKLYIRNKIKELRNNHKDFKNPKEPTFIYSISFLNGLLGDAYYFDQEYDDAIISYLDALQYLRDESSMSLEKFTMLLQLKLKLGLIHEKMKSYETAISYYNDIIYNSQDFLLKYEKGELKKTTKDKLITVNEFKIGNQTIEKFTGKIADKFRKEGDDRDFRDIISMDELLQIINQAYIASLYIHEKLSASGVTLPKLSNYQEVFKKIVGMSGKQEGLNFLIMSNYHSNVATMLYFKNLVPLPLKKQSSKDGDITLKSSKIKTLVSNNFDKYKGNELIKINKDADKNTPSPKNIRIHEPKLFDGVESKYEKGNKDYRFSFYSFLTYKQALEFLLTLNQKNSSLVKLCKDGVEIISGTDSGNFENRYNKSYLINIALLFSRIGDVLFTTYEASNKKGDKATNEDRGNKTEAKEILYDISLKWQKKIELDKKIESLRKEVDEKIKSDNIELKILQTCKNLIDQFTKQYNKIEEEWWVKKNIKKIEHLNSDYDFKNHLDELKGNYARMPFFDQWLENFVPSKNITDEKAINSYWDKQNELNIIIFLYYLSGRFYSKAGKSVSHSFQLRKIIQIITNCVEIIPESPAGQKNLLQLVQEAILPMILEIASWNSNSTDRPQIYKHKFLVRLDETNVIYHPRHLSKHIYSNISNNPETKEAIMLFAQLKVKSIDFSTFLDLKTCVETCEEQALINQNGNISTQFSRILELDLQNNINRAFLKTNISKKFNEIIYKNLLIKKELFEGDILKLWETSYYKIYKKYNPSDISDRYTKLNSKLSEKINAKHPLSESEEEVKSIDDLLLEKIKLVERIIDALATKDIDKKNKKIIDEYAALITNSIFCLRQIISVIKIYDVNYYLSYAYLAHFHRELGVWLQHYKLCQEIYRKYVKNNGGDFSEINILDIALKDQLGPEAMTTLDATSQFQIALQLYHKSKEIHSNGAAYQSAINNFIYLEDDFNDNLYHFGVALERQLLNSYVIRKRIKVLEADLKDSPLYNYYSYANNDEPK